MSPATVAALNPARLAAGGPPVRTVAQILAKHAIIVRPGGMAAARGIIRISRSNSVQKVTQNGDLLAWAGCRG